MRGAALFLTLLFLAAAPARAEDPTSTSTSTSTDTNKATDWKATKYNDQMLNDQVDGYAVDQTSANIVVSNVLYACVDTNIEGRTDVDCQKTPEHPECIGLTKALGNATTCLNPKNPTPDQPCQQYGTADYTMDEWIAFGTQYHQTMSACYDQKQKTDAGTLSSVNGKSLVRMASITAEVTDGTGASAKGTRDPSASDVTGRAAPSTAASATPVNGSSPSGAAAGTAAPRDLSALDDGSAALGYSNGEVLKRTAAGETFYQIVTESPFAQKLNPAALKQLEHGLAESSLVLDQARASGRLAPLGVDPAEYAAATADHAPESGAGSATSTATSLAGDATDAKKPEFAVATPSPTPAAAPSPVTADAAPNRPDPDARRPLLAERIAQLEAAAKRRLSGDQAAAKIPLPTLQAPKPKRGPASFLGASDVTLFKRVHLAYQRRLPALKEQGSPEGRALRAMETPALFRETSRDL